MQEQAGGVMYFCSREGEVALNYIGCSQCGDSFDLVSEKCDIASFIEEHAGEPAHQSKLKDLRPRYCAIRKARADGSCFFRGLAFSYLESLLGDRQEIVSFRERVTESRNELLAGGFQEQAFGRCYSTFLSVVDLAESDGSVSALLRAFNNPDISDNAVRYLRLVTSAFLRNRAEFYQPFVEEGLQVTDFCTQYVEPMTAVCDHIHISALTQALAIPLQVEYVDSMDSAINQHTFPDGARPSIYMLYKQDHYTVLYRVLDQGAEQ
ncbi:PREDICTED: ubiquitin thioesterase OTUB2 [Nanorana parkeri]|uniref:ubiquitin thioesterase OTUB2 n=1 Tax=Nanorana parkeri TaxID=125878 RepID=UPI0008549B20|nr:PREDICTED: ubiquitin thioesterase OTUB2 [Nanorana parkeri]